MSIVKAAKRDEGNWTSGKSNAENADVVILLVKRALNLKHELSGKVWNKNQLNLRLANKLAS